VRSALRQLLPARVVKNSNGLKWRGLGFCTGSCLNGLLRPRDSAYNLAFTKIMDYRESKMLWPRLLAYVTGTVNQELLLRNEYSGAENRI